MIRAVFLIVLLITGCTSVEKAPDINGAYFDNLFDSDFFAREADPFQEMHRLTQQQSAEAEKPSTYRNAFNSWYWDRFGQYPAEQIHYREDEKTFFITFDVDALDNPTVNLKMEDGVVFVNGQLVRTTRWSERKLRLNQRLPVPSNLDASSLFSWKNGEEYIIRIEKLATTSQVKHDSADNKHS